MMQAIAIDDEPLALDVIRAFCDRTASVSLDKVFTEPTEALKYLRKHPVDLLFLDVRMPAMSGLDFYKALGQNAMVIFTTAYSEYAVEGFNLSAIDYLLKPILYERFVQAIGKAEDYQRFLHSKDSQPQYLFLRIDYSLVKLAVGDIVYIEGLDNYLKIHVRNGKPLVVRMSMKAMNEKLHEQQFLRVHRSYIISTKDIESVRNKQITIGGAIIPVGTNYEQVVRDMMNG